MKTDFDCSENLFSFYSHPNDYLNKKRKSLNSHISIFMISDAQIKAVVLYLQIDFHPINLKTGDMEQQ